MDPLRNLLMNQKSLVAAYNSESEGVVILDNNHRVLFLSDLAKQILNVTNLEQVSLNDWPVCIGLYHINEQTYLTLSELPFLIALQGIAVNDFRLVLRREPNYKAYLSFNSRPLRDLDNIIIGSVTTFRDISILLNNEQRIIEERFFYQRLLDFIPAQIMIKDLEGRYIYANKKFREIYLPDSHLGKTVADILPPQKAFLKLEELTRKVLFTKKEVEDLVKLEHWDGTKCLYHTIYFPLLESDNSVSAICILRFDVTQKVEHEKAMENERIKNVNASKLASLGSLAAEIGHEINNPLGVIRVTLAALKLKLEAGEPLQKILRQIEIIDMTTTRITNIVSALKHISRDSRNEEFTTCTIKEILHDIQLLSSTKLKLKNITFHLKMTNVDSGDKIYCLRIQFSQVLLNIIVNACDAVSHLPSPWIKLVLSQDQDFYLFQIIDSGPGVAKEIQEKIFEPFFTTKEFGEGTGLGLSISKEIMKRHNGNIIYENSNGSSYFKIILPKGD